MSRVTGTRGIEHPASLGIRLELFALQGKNSEKSPIECFNTGIVPGALTLENFFINKMLGPRDSFFDFRSRQGFNQRFASSDDANAFTAYLKAAKSQGKNSRKVSSKVILHRQCARGAVF